jgi:hypothetical protein
MNSMSVKGEKKNLMVYLVMSYHVITSVSLALTSLIKYNLNIPYMWIHYDTMIVPFIPFAEWMVQ